MILNSPFLPGTKSAGGLTLAKWKGKNTARARIYQNSSKSSKQIFQRARFAYVNNWAIFVGTSIIKLLWQKYEKNTTYMNEFNSYNVPLQPTYVDEATPFAGVGTDIKLGKGDLEQVPLSGAQNYDDATGDVTVVWDDTITGNGLATDKVVIVVTDGESLTVKTELTKTRTDGTATITMPAGLTGDQMTVYISAYRDSTAGKRSVALGDAADVTVV
jgi:hypothetical protein